MVTIFFSKVYFPNFNIYNTVLRYFQKSFKILLSFVKLCAYAYVIIPVGKQSFFQYIERIRKQKQHCLQNKKCE